MKKKLDKKDSVWLGFDVKVEPGPIARPKQIHFWKDDDFKGVQPQNPFHYFSDALVGLSLIQLNTHFKNPFTAPQVNYPFCSEAWLALEPHHELYSRSQARVHALQKHCQKSAQGPTEYFERNFSDILAESLHPWGMDLTHLTHLVEAIDYLETKLDQPLLYDFGLQFSKPVVEKLHHLHSLLFHLRALMAVDYNCHIQDPSHEACKVDSITDYLAKAEYVANDGILYYNFKKQKNHIKSEAYSYLEKSFKTYSHNGYCLIEALPPSFLNSLHTTELEETLYIVQMDWLLGTEAGLLFRVREELYGLIEGYEKIFYPEVDGKPFHEDATLSVSCEVSTEILYPKKKRAA